MRKLLTASSLAGMALAAVLGTSAVAQEPEYTFESKLEMTPQRSGTKSHPRGVRLDGRLDFGDVFKLKVPVITAGRVLLPRGFVYNGGRYPKCSAATMKRGGKSLKNCPKGSIVGRGRTVFSEEVKPVRVFFFNGGARRMWAYTTVFSPALVEMAVPIAVKRLHGPRWSYELTFESPANLQAMPGVPWSGFPFAIGGKPDAPDYLATNDRCPKRGFRPYEVSLSYRFHPDGPAGTSVDRGRLACK